MTTSTVPSVPVTLGLHVESTERSDRTRFLPQDRTTHVISEVAAAVGDAGDGGLPVARTQGTRTAVTYRPILDVARGVAAGFQAQGDVAADGLVRRALADFPTLPKNTFVSVPVASSVLSSPAVRDALLGHRAQHGATSLAGVVLEVVGFSSAEPPGPLEDAVAEYRERGALIAVGGHGAAQPELTSIVRLKPAIIRLGRDWIRGIDRSDAKRSAIEVTGQLAGQLDAWVLAEGVSTSAELRSLAGLGVPLAEGPFIGEPQGHWPEIEIPARTALPKPAPASDGVLRGLLQQVYTATDAAAAAAVLPETTGFDVVVVVDTYHRPTSMLELDNGHWGESEVLAVNIDTALPDAVARAMARPRPVRFTPLVCTDNAGRALGILRIERLMSHLIEPSTVS